MKQISLIIILLFALSCGNQNIKETSKRPYDLIDEGVVWMKNYKKELTFLNFIQIDSLSNYKSPLDISHNFALIKTDDIEIKNVSFEKWVLDHLFVKVWSLVPTVDSDIQIIKNRIKIECDKNSISSDILRKNFKSILFFEGRVYFIDHNIFSKDLKEKNNTLLSLINNNFKCWN